MQLILRVVNCPPGTALLSGVFGAGGGSIGRSPDCTLALPDPKRYLSRVHAEIRQKGESFQLKVLSQVNPVVVNGQNVGFHEAVELQQGDRLVLGDYELVAEVTQADSPFAPNQGFSDPFAIFDNVARPSKPGDDTVKDPFKQPAPETPRKPLDNMLQGVSGATAGQSLSDLLTDSSAGNSQDPLMGILQTGATGKTTTQAAGFPGLPRQTGNADEATLGKFLNTGGGVSDVDPMSLLGGGGSAPAAVSPLGRHSDHVHDVNLPFSPPPVVGTQAPTQKPLPGSGQPPAGGAIDDDIFASLTAPATKAIPAAPAMSSTAAALPDDIFSVLDGLVQTPATPQASAPVQVLPGVAVPTEPETPGIPIPLAAETPHAMMPAVSSAEGTRLLEKFAEGLALPGFQIPAEDAETYMLESGRMLRHAIEGIYNLLILRAEVKKELRADERTMIASRENNPLKHTDTVDEALRYMMAFKQPNPAFLPAVRAIEDAFNDVQAHELAVMAGMRAGLTGVLKRFDPETLEKRIKKSGALNAVVPALYKAKLWDTFLELYQDIEKEAEDQFDKLFGKEFVRAYMEQTKRLRKTSKKP